MHGLPRHPRIPTGYRTTRRKATKMPVTPERAQEERQFVSQEGNRGGRSVPHPN